MPPRTWFLVKFTVIPVKVAMPASYNPPPSPWLAAPPAPPAPPVASPPAPPLPAAPPAPPFPAKPLPARPPAPPPPPKASLDVNALICCLFVFFFAP